jgi:hypothetical protein
MTLPLQRVLSRSAPLGAPLPALLRRSMIGVALLSLALCAAAFAIDRVLPTPDLFYITGAFFQAHDAFWAVALGLFLIGLAVSPLPTGPFQGVKRRSPRAHWSALFALALLVVMLGALGAHQALLDYPLSWDECLARFDALIFRSGRTVAPLAEEWRRYADALAWQSFMQPVADHAALVSAYLPVNAGLRALIGGFADERLTSPLLAALAILSAYGVGRRLWPDRRDAGFVAALLVLTSCQVLVTAMTPYAMTAHLAFNLLWLWLFLRDTRLSHAGAILIGFLACGLHQLVFHPLFAAPFIFSLYRQKRIALALVYALFYAGIGLFWISYWKIGLALQDLAAPGAAPGAGAIAGTRFFVERVASLLIDYEWQSVPLMLKNSLRFIVWQNPLLLPLAALSGRAFDHAAFERSRSNADNVIDLKELERASREKPVPTFSQRAPAQDRPYARELLAGVLLTFAVMCLLMPYQGHGWGYRYLHGLIGNLALLAGFGWIAATRGATMREGAAMRAALFLSSAFSLCVLLPAHLEDAHAVTEPYARADAAIRRAKSDIVLIDKTGMRYGGDFARNDPFMRERPVRLALDKLSDADLAALCARYRLELFDASSGAAFGVPLNEAELVKRDLRLRAPCAAPFDVPSGEKLRGGGRQQPPPRLFTHIPKDTGAARRSSLEVAAPIAPDVNAEEEEDPDHVHEVPIPLGEFQAEMLFRLEVAGIGAQQAHEQEDRADDHVHAVETGRHEEGRAVVVGRGMARVVAEDEGRVDELISLERREQQAEGDRDDQALDQLIALAVMQALQTPHERAARADQNHRVDDGQPPGVDDHRALRRPDAAEELGAHILHGVHREGGGVEEGPEPGDEEHHLGEDEERHAPAQAVLHRARVEARPMRLVDHVAPPDEHRRKHGREANEECDAPDLLRMREDRFALVSGKPDHRAGREDQHRARHDDRPGARIDETIIAVLVGRTSRHSMRMRHLRSPLAR